jgi:hypothetical protein
VAVHAGGRAGQIGEPRFFHAIVTIAAIHTELARVDFVGERHRLHWLIARAGIFRRAINSNSGNDSATGQRRTDDERQRQPICPFRENHCCKKLKKQQTENCHSNHKVGPVI